MTVSEENYLKAVYQLAARYPEGVPTNALADQMNSKPSSVTDMIKKLSDKGWLWHRPYQGVGLTEMGHKAATQLVRRHRLWEVFLVEKLGFRWDEVHDLAEELEHVNSDALINRLDAFLGYPKTDPHGDLIPDAEGQLPLRSQRLLSQLAVEQRAVLLGVRDSSTAFLQYLDRLQLQLGCEMQIVAIDAYDESLQVEYDGKVSQIGPQAARQLIVKVL